MAQRLILGTVRGRIGGQRHTVALTDGSVLRVQFEGEVMPRIGADVIGILDDSSGENRIELVPDVAKRMLKGKRTKIIPFGRPDVTARMLAYLLDGTGPALIRPGVGGIIERTPIIKDPDLRWALSILEPEAARLGLALNVVDPLALAAAAWTDRDLVDAVLPADASGERGALSDLKALMADAFQPACRRTLLGLGRGAKTPSVDFVIPYSPFLTGATFCARIGGAWHSEYAFPAISSDDARRLSSFREISLSFAARYLGTVSRNSEVARHLEECFADAAATTAFLRSGGDPAAALRFAAFREAGAARWNKEGSCPPQTWSAIRAAVSAASSPDLLTTDDLLKHAASVALIHAPRGNEAILAGALNASDKDTFIDLETAGPHTKAALERHFQQEVAENVARLASHGNALARMAKFAPLIVPMGFEDAFEELVRPALGSIESDDNDIRPLSFLDDEAPALRM
ncbi:hypothetical protein [Bosea sp. ANAM02]|uniref:hypothetical protein n=1 Tax=Bosea sp. ANAM02 TaxID=2020412 RepID=UPI0015641572|nr:hypothetical protein [Bosea sp. ANAM02]